MQRPELLLVIQDFQQELHQYSFDLKLVWIVIQSQCKKIEFFDLHYLLLWHKYLQK